MSLRIELPDEHRLTAVGGDWLLPKLTLRTDGKPVHVSSIFADAEGEPAAARQAIQAASKVYERRFAMPQQLIESVELGKGLKVVGAGPVPPKLDCRIKFTVTYYQDRRGRPNKDPEPPIVKICRLVYDADAKAPDDAPEPEIAVTPGQSILSGGQAVQLRIEVRHPRSPARPKVALVFPETAIDPGLPGLPALEGWASELARSLAAAVDVAPRRGEASGDIEAYLLDLEVDLGPLSRNSAARELARRVGLYVPIRIEYEGAQPVSHQIKLESSDDQFTGWLAIDLGTTGSTVTVYEPRRREALSGLPHEQEDVLRRQLAGWFRQEAADALPDGRVLEKEWRDFHSKIEQAAAGRPGETLSLAELFHKGQSEKVHQVIAAIETTLKRATYSDRFLRAVYLRLNEFFDKALRVPPLSLLDIYPVELDPTRRRPEIASEVFVRRAPEDNQPADVAMGAEVAQKRKEALAGAIAARGNPEEAENVISRCFPSPKRYFGTNRKPFELVIDQQRHRVSVPQLMQASWHALRRLAEDAQQRDPHFGKEPFRRVVATYPTAAPPTVRDEIRRLIAPLGFNQVITQYDEATSAAVFYLMREFGGNSDLGLEAFKARCHVENGRRWQNVLIFDIGGGTTDLALIRLELQEEDPFRPGEDRGAGGRYYVIRPTLLGASGLMRCGGELITLRVYRLLKAIIVDHLLTLLAQGRIQSSALTERAQSIDERFLINHSYEPGALLRHIDKEEPEQDRTAFRKARELAERILPTAWKDTGMEDRIPRLMAFHWLWDHAEEAKKQLGGKAEGSGRAMYHIGPDQIMTLLQRSKIDCKALDPERDLTAALDPESLDRALRPVIREAVTLAKGLVENKFAETNEQIDWLIKSGNSCKLAMVDQEFRRVFRESPHFTWNPERVTFDPEHAKLATSIGACCAEFSRRYKTNAEATKPQLRKGVSQFYFDVDNLSHYLPYSFRMISAGIQDYVPIFTARTELYQIDERPIGKAQSGDPQGAREQITLIREDYEGGPRIPWGILDVLGIMENMKVLKHDWENHLTVLFEIDQDLRIEALIWRGRPRRWVKAGLPERPISVPIDQPLFDTEGTLLYDVGIRRGMSVPPDYDVVFPRGLKLDEEFRVSATADDDEAAIAPIQGTRCERWLRAEEFSNNALTLELRAGDAQPWQPIGPISRPTDRAAYPRRYRLSLDERGVVRLHPGEVPFWESDRPDVLKPDSPQIGRVYRCGLQQKNQESDEERDPYSGIH